MGKHSISDEQGPLKMIEGCNIVNQTDGFAKDDLWRRVVKSNNPNSPEKR